jgi:hypothetical protein
VIKKTFLAVAVGAALGSVGANAAPTFTFDVNDWTTEGAMDVTDFAVPDINVTLGTEYTPNDVIKFTFSQDIDGDYKPTIVVTQSPSTSTSYTMTLGLIASDANSATYRVTELTTAGSGSITTTGATFTLTSAASSDLTVDGAAVRAAGGLTATYSATTADTGLALDGGSQAITQGASPVVSSFISFVDQYATVAASSLFSNTIDVEPGTSTATRSVFTTGAGVDSATVSVTETNSATHDALTSGLTVTLTGDFSFLVDSDTGTAGLQPSTGALYAGLNGGAHVQATMNAAGTQATFEWDNGGSDTSALALGNVGMVFNNSANGAGTAAIEPGSFSVAVDVEYKPADATYDGENGTQTYAVASNEETTSEGSTAVGSWGLNGSMVTVYAAPAYPGITETFLWMTNSSAKTAPVNIVATTSAGVDKDLGTVATLAANSITRISSELESALTAAGVTNDRVTLTITTSAPACDVNVAASYKHVGDADRLALETTQTLQGVHNTGNSGTTDDLCAL